MAGVMSLAGRTIFITGASRGIGKAIALRCAQDGANIVIAAKSGEPHPKLPGTIHTAAEEIKAAGGQALACVVDVQSEEQVTKAVEDAVKKFGGIDILVNNASAIQLTGTEATSMKRYDLMHHINTRGTFLCSKVAAPHLKKGKNPHILNISPPLNMNPRWFRDHVAYTMAKYGMSMCALGMAEEFRGDGVAVNCLWPRTAIYTAAMEMLGGGEAVKNQCRSVDIMCDAAHLILTKDSGSFTGNFCIDDDVLRESGVTNLDKYSMVPGENLLPDFFLDEALSDSRMPEIASHGYKVVKNTTSSGASVGDAAAMSGSGNAELDQTLGAIRSMLSPDVVKGVNGIFNFNLKDAGMYHLDLKNGSGAVGSGEGNNKADVTFSMSGKDFVKMFAGQMNPTSAFMTGKMKIKGDLGLAMKLEKLMKQMNKAKL